MSKESPMLNKNHETVLHYVDGSICPENSNKLISSNFTFPCYNNDKVINQYLLDYKKILMILRNNIVIV